MCVSNVALIRNTFGGGTDWAVDIVEVSHPELLADKDHSGLALARLGTLTCRRSAYEGRCS